MGRTANPKKTTLRTQQQDNSVRPISYMLARQSLTHTRQPSHRLTSTWVFGNRQNFIRWHSHFPLGPLQYRSTKSNWFWTRPVLHQVRCTQSFGQADTRQEASWLP